MLRSRVAESARTGAGLSPSARLAAWPLLLDPSRCGLTASDRAASDEARAGDYARLKAAWAGLLPEQRARNRPLRERQSRVDKDVVRTDRDLAFYAGDGNAHVESLRAALYTYSCSFAWDLGELQAQRSRAASGR